jgi:hypothetical protein
MPLIASMNKQSARGPKENSYAAAAERLASTLGSIWLMETFLAAQTRHNLPGRSQPAALVAVLHLRAHALTVD